MWRDDIHPSSDITQIESLTWEIEGAVALIEEFTVEVDETHKKYANEMIASCQIVHLSVHASTFNLRFTQQFCCCHPGSEDLCN